MMPQTELPAALRFHVDTPCCHPLTLTWSLTVVDRNGDVNGSSLTSSLASSAQSVSRER